ncbi:MAG: hypothetical protein G01um101416_416 [Microgenomates group bacterium Gr01-1014_16]|nr:MAG: hypothetical protein G01um101416_416 [Microgenomates group bacterium Gr01-1014_16]
MLDKKFTPPDPIVSQKETEKRKEILDSLLPDLKKFANVVMITGSMAYGQNFSVTEKSDIDAQILIDRTNAFRLLDFSPFKEEKIKVALEAFFKGIVDQFSLSTPIEGIPFECHFWEESALVKAMVLESQSTIRLRSSLTPPSVDYGFSFDGSEDEQELPGKVINIYVIGELPSYRRHDNKLFLCRPITNGLSNPFIVHGYERVQPAIDKSWSIIVRELIDFSGPEIDLSKNNVINTLPGKFKTSEDIKKQITERTKQELRKQEVVFLE